MPDYMTPQRLFEFSNDELTRTTLAMRVSKVKAGQASMAFCGDRNGRCDRLSLIYKLLDLDSLALFVKAAEFGSLDGGNGAGKSSPMKTISGLEIASAGRVIFVGRDITRISEHQRVPLGIVQSPEGRQLFADQTVHDNLILGAYHRDAGAAEFAADSEKQFKNFPRLCERHNQMAGTLFGGEQKMLAISRALMLRPKLLLDEPSLGLAPLIVKEVFNVIRNLKAHGVTILLVEQMANRPLAVAERAYVPETGRITIQGRGEDLRRDPRFHAAYLGEH